MGHIRKLCYSLLGRLESLGQGAITADVRTRRALEQNGLWTSERRADAMAVRKGFNLVRRGFGKLD